MADSGDSDFSFDVFAEKEKEVGFVIKVLYLWTANVVH
jgi:hypothetical protein